MSVPGASVIRPLTLLSAFALLLQSLGVVANAQQPNQQADVVKVSTELVQTAITVVDKEGHFVDGLTRDQFQLTIDGQPRPINLFERVTAGSAREAQIARNAAIDTGKNSVPAPATVHGRRVVFFVDDLHLSPESLDRTRQMLRHFLNDQMTHSDTVAIVSASGQIGFLQQFTNNKQVLEAALARLYPRQYDARGFGTGSTKMTEYLALNIENEKSDQRILGFYVAECMKQNMPPKRSAAYSTLVAALRATCETDVKSSARAILMQGAQITQNMYASLDSLMRSSARAPGRKLAFFISDGFLMDAGAHAAGLRDKLDRIIDAATRAGVVIYTIDARGLGTSAVVDAANSRPMAGSADPAVATAQIGEIAATQDAMNALAGDTGGRALRNVNYFDKWVGRVLDETSNYYLLAWRPENDQEKLPKFRQIKVTIAGRPDLTVRAPRGYVMGPTAETIAETKPPENSSTQGPEGDLRNALSDYNSTNSLPTMLSLTYLNTPKNETVLTSSMQISTRELTYGDDGKQPSVIKIAGVVLNDKGKIASSFKNQLNVKPLDGVSLDGAVMYNQPTTLAPGIYQVRVAAREEMSGRIGSAMDWIVIPDLTTHQLTTSSLLLDGHVLEARGKDTAQVQLSVDRRFARSSALGYWIFVYNAKRDPAGSPNLTITTEVRRDGLAVISSPQRKIDHVSDVDRIPFGEQVSLRSLAPGRYDLAVTITDTIAGATVTQIINFEVV